MATLNKFLRENKVNKMSKAERNAWYDSLTKPQKAVAICEDVLLQIKNEKYVMSGGSYVNLQIAYDITQRTVKDIFKKTALDEVLNAKSITCKVCAMGSCLLSAIRLGNEVKVDDIMEFDSDWTSVGPYNGEPIIQPGDSVEQSDHIDWTKLSEAFTKKEYRAMEYLFEGKDIVGTFGEEYNLWADIKDISLEQAVLHLLFNDEYEHLSSTDKMIKMCKQIIKAGGYFLVEGVDLDNTSK